MAEPDPRSTTGAVAGERPPGAVPGMGPNGAPYPGPAGYPASAPQRLGGLGAPGSRSDGPGHNGSGHNGSGYQGSGQNGLGQNGLGYDGSGTRGSAPSGTGQNGLGQNGSGPNGAGHHEFGANGSGANGAAGPRDPAVGGAHGYGSSAPGGHGSAVNGANGHNGSAHRGGPQPGSPDLDGATAPLAGGPIRPTGPPIPPRAAPRRVGPGQGPAPDDRPTDIVPAADLAPNGLARGNDPARGNDLARSDAPAAPDDEAGVDAQLRVDTSSTGPDGVPGRHRRRAGASPDSHPAADYVAKRAPGTRKPRTGRRRRSTFWKELPILIGVALVLTIVIQAFVAKVYVIPSGSMETTLHGCTGCNNDRVLVDKVTYRFTEPAPGDVVVFRGPDSWVNTEFSVDEPTSTFGEVTQQFLSLIGLAPPDEKDFVKRVIAVGGQTVACCDSRNRVMVDGEPLDEPYIYYLPAAGPARQIPFGPVTVPQGELWVMGDSRNNSSDSRIDGHGPIPVDNVIGKARMKVLPVSRFGFIDDTDPQAVALGEDPGGVPAALGVFGVLPFVLVRRRLLDREDDEFLPRRP